MKCGEIVLQKGVLTSTLTLRTEPADSAMNTLLEGEFGSKTAAAIFDLSKMGLPNLLPDLASRFCLLPRSALCGGISLQLCHMIAGLCLLGFEKVAGV